MVDIVHGTSGKCLLYMVRQGNVYFGPGNYKFHQYYHAGKCYQKSLMWA